MFKRFLLLILSVCSILCYTVYASNVFSVDAGKNFYVYGKQDEEISVALGIPKDEIKEYCGKNVIYLACNKDNSKQIRITAGQNAFTYSAVNISNFSNDKIMSLIPQITGIENIKGEIINKNGQKFIKTELRSTDSGGDYILTEYITVADKKSFVLSFYTDVNANKDYIEKVFQTYECDYFINEKSQSKSILEFVLPAFTIVFGVVTVIIAVTVIIDIRKRKVLNTEESPTEETNND